MTPEHFAYWLQGKLEGRDITEISHEELRQIPEHLALVFEKRTPGVGRPQDKGMICGGRTPDGEPTYC